MLLAAMYCNLLWLCSQTAGQYAGHTCHNSYQSGHAALGHGGETGDQSQLWPQLPWQALACALSLQLSGGCIHVVHDAATL